MLQYQLPETEEALALGTAPLPAEPYYKDAYFELEREVIFKRTWLNIGHECEVDEPGQFIVRELDFAAVSVLITRTNEGELRAFHNVCTHRGTQLVSDLAGRKRSFTCPYHGWTFNNTGELRGAPDFERFYVDKSDCSLSPISIASCGGLIFVNLDPEPEQSLLEYLGSFADEWEQLPMARATTYSEYVYEIDGNWKLTYDNFQENYHLRFIHPRSGGGGAVGEENPFGYPARIEFHGEHRTQEIWTNPQPTLSPTQQRAFGRLIPSLMRRGAMNHPFGRRYWAVFPNLFILGTPTQPFVHYVMPISARKSRGVIRIYWEGEDQNASERFGREFSMAMARDVHCEDRAVIEAGQRGLNSGALKHIHLQSQEVLLRHLMVNVQRKIDAYQAKQSGSNRV
jgi:phenylpropionate dioxygenase-like ring-hydroxylating dioxygenase large terminal subunit